MPAKVVNLKFQYVNNSQWYQINIQVSYSLTHEQEKHYRTPKHLICVVQILTEK